MFNEEKAKAIADKLDIKLSADNASKFTRAIIVECIDALKEKQIAAKQWKGQHFIDNAAIQAEVEVIQQCISTIIKTFDK